MRISDWSSDVCSSDLPAFTYAGDSMTMARVGISQDVPNAAKRHAQQARAQADIAAAEANGFVEVRRVKVATALAWIDLYYAERRLAAIDAVIARQNGLAVAAHSGVASGAARPAQTRDEIGRESWREWMCPYV